jgi:L-lactate permease
MDTLLAYTQVFDRVGDSLLASTRPRRWPGSEATVGLGGQEGELFRRVLWWSIILLLIMCVLVYLQSTSLLSWMVV